MGYFQVRYNSRVVVYNRRGFIRLATAVGSNPGLGLILHLNKVNKTVKVRKKNFKPFLLTFLSSSYPVVDVVVGIGVDVDVGAAVAFNANAQESNSTIFGPFDDVKALSSTMWSLFHIFIIF